MADIDDIDDRKLTKEEKKIKRILQSLNEAWDENGTDLIILTLTGQNYFCLARADTGLEIGKYPDINADGGDLYYEVREDGKTYWLDT